MTDEPSRRRRRARRPPTRTEWLVAAVTAAALVVGVVALVFALRPPPAPAAYTPAPPLAPPPQSTARSSNATPRVPATVRLIIPAAKINLGVVEGDGLHVPMDLAAHYPGTAEPGENSNAVFYAHAQPGMFQGLYLFHLADEIEALRADGSSLTYQVTAIKYVSYNDRSVLDPTSYDQVTLLTCKSYDPYTDRFIVIATRL